MGNAAAGPEGNRATALATFLTRVGRYALIFGTGHGVQLAIGLATTVFLTHELGPTEYGHLALYMLVPSTVMIVCNLATLQGTMGIVFGKEGDDEGVIEEDAGPGFVPDGDVRALFMTGIVTTLAISLVVAIGVFLAADSIAAALGDIDDGRTLVLIGLFTGVVGAQWRLIGNFQRYAGRPVAFVTVHTSRAFFSLVGIIILVRAGEGLKGVMLGFAFGTLAAVVVAVSLARRDLTLAFQPRAVGEILARGSRWTPVVGSMWLIQSFDIYMVSLFAGVADVGIYRLASNLARFASYGVSTFLYSWGALLKTPLAVAVSRERGASTGATWLTGYVAVASFAVLAIGVLGDVLVRVAPASFGAAATLIPLLALVPIGRGFFVTVYIGGRLPNKQRLFIILMVCAAVVFAIAAAVFGPSLGAYGVGLAGVMAFFLPAIAMLVLSRYSEQALPLRWRSLVIPPVAAGALLAVELSVEPPTGADAALKVATIAAFPLLMLATGVIPRGSITAFAGALRLVRNARRDHGELSERISSLEPRVAEIVFQIVRSNRPAAAVAARIGCDEDAVLADLVAGLARAAGVAPPRGGLDLELARYLVFAGPLATKSARARGLVSHGLDPLVLDSIEQVIPRLRFVRRRNWPHAHERPAPDRVVEEVSLL